MTTLNTNLNTNLTQLDNQLIAALNTTINNDNELLSNITFGEETMTNELNTTTNQDITVSAQQAEINTQRQVAQDKIGQAEAVIAWLNTNLVNLPELCGGRTNFKIKDSKGRQQDKTQANSDTVWLVGMETLGFNGYVNKGIMATAMMNWNNEVKGSLTQEVAEKISMSFIRRAQELNIVSGNLISRSVKREDGKQIQIKGSVFTEEFQAELLDIVTDLRARVEMKMTPLANRPQDWTSVVDGVGTDAQVKLISNYKLRTTHVEDKVLNAVNKLQGTAWRINQDAVQAAKDVQLNKHLYNGQLNEMFSDKELSTEAFAVYAEAVRCANMEEFYSVVTMDNRGRLYARSGILSFQGTDFAKSAVEFAEGAKLGKHGLKALSIQIANCLGYDKLARNAKVKLVKKNVNVLMAVNTHMDVRKAFPKAEVFQALVAIKDMQRALRSGDVENYVSHVVCHSDATASGIQHMSGITKSRQSAKAVNLTACDNDTAVSDLYGKVAAAAVAIAEEGEAKEVLVKHGRKITKHLVMLASYGAGDATLQGTIANALIKVGEDAQLAKAIYEVAKKALIEVVPALSDFGSSMKEVITRWINENPMARKLQFTSPDGFKVGIAYFDNEEDKVRVGNLTAVAKRGGDQTLVDFKMVNSMLPHFIHQLDACHVRMVLNRVDAPLAMIHDSIGSRAGDFFKVARVIRETFALIHMQANFDNFCAEIDQDAPQFIGEFDVKEVMNSANMFC